MNKILVDSFSVEDRYQVGTYVNYRIMVDMDYDSIGVGKDPDMAITLERYNEDGSINTGPTLKSYSGIRNDRTAVSGDLLYQFCFGTMGKVVYASDLSPFAYIVDQVDAEYCSVTNPACDLANLTAVKTNETTEGAADAKIVVSSSSTHQPVTYVLTGVGVSRTQTTTQFLGLRPGTYWIDATDALGCKLITSVVIPSMRKTLVSTPEAQVSAGNVSRWSAAFNPVVFKYQRKDFRIDYIQALSPTYILVSLNLNASIPLSGDDVLLMASRKCTVKTEKYSFSLKPVSININGSELFFDLTGLMTGVDDNTGGLMNAFGIRSGHRFVTEITFGNEAVKRVVTARHSAGLDGIATADVSRYLQTAINPKDSFKYDQINHRDTGLSVPFSVRYKEEWDAGSSEWTMVDQPFFATYSALQLNNGYGSNMARYVTFLNEPAEANKAKFLCESDKPHLHLGLPFDVAFIYSAELAGKQLILSETGHDLNGVQVFQSAEVINYLTTESGAYFVQPDGSKLVASRTAALALLDQSSGVNRLMVGHSLPDTAVRLEVYVYYRDDTGAAVRITEVKQISVRSLPCSDYQYLKWIGPKGGWNYSMFDFRATVSLDVEETETVDHYLSDYESQDATSDVIYKTGSKTVTVGKNGLEASEMEVAASLLMSPKVYLLTSLNPIRWQTVIVEAKGTELYDTRQKRGDIEFKFRLPAMNVQNQ